MHHYGLDCFAIAQFNLDIGVHHNVQNDGVVGRIVLMMVTIPVRCLDVHLYVASPHYAVFLDLGIEEVGPCIVVAQSRVKYIEGFVVERLNVEEEALLPYKIHEFLHGLFLQEFEYLRIVLSCNQAQMGYIKC